MSGRNKFEGMAKPIDEDPVGRARVEELGRAYDALIASHKRRPPEPEHYGEGG